MNTRRASAVLFSLVMSLPLISQAGAESPTEIRGAAILDHPCGKVAVKHMGLVHDGQARGGRQAWHPGDAGPVEGHARQGPRDDVRNDERDVEAGGAARGLDQGRRVLVIEGNRATLTVKQEHKDANGTVTDTLTQSYVLDGTTCRITR